MNRESRAKGEGGRHRPDVSHTLRMWLWLTFHLPAWPAASHPSLSSHLPVRMSAVFLDTASAPRRRPRFPRPLTICGPAASDRPPQGGLKSGQRLDFFNPLLGKKRLIVFSPASPKMATSSCLLPKDSLTTAATFLQMWKPTVCNKSNKSVFFCGKRIIQGCDIDEALLWQWRKGNIS